MQKSKGLFLLKRALILGIVLAFSGAQRAAMTKGMGGLVTTGATANSVTTGATGTIESLATGRTIATTANQDMGREIATTGATGRTGNPAITWMDLEEASGKLQKEQRPVLIDLYTTWCGWCKQMDKKTYSNKQVAAYVQDKFYPVKLDAETHSVLTWKGREYRFNAGYRSNEFAVYLTHGQLEFPTTIIIPPGGEPQAIPGYMEPKELELLVKYFGEGKYDKMSFDEYQKTFRPSW